MITNDTAQWNENLEAAYLNPADADAALKQLLNGTGEEECDGETHSRVQRHRHKHTAGRDGISQKDVEGEGDEDDDLAGAEEGGHVEASQIGALHDLGDLLAVNTKRSNNHMAWFQAKIKTPHTWMDGSYDLHWKLLIMTKVWWLNLANKNAFFYQKHMNLLRFALIFEIKILILITSLRHDSLGKLEVWGLWQREILILAFQAKRDYEWAGVFVIPSSHRAGKWCQNSGKNHKQSQLNNKQDNMTTMKAQLWHSCDRNRKLFLHHVSVWCYRKHQR